MGTESLLLQELCSRKLRLKWKNYLLALAFHESDIEHVLRLLDFFLVLEQIAQWVDVQVTQDTSQQLRMRTHPLSFLTHHSDKHLYVVLRLSSPNKAFSGHNKCQNMLTGR